MHRELERYCDELDLRLTEKQARDLGFDYHDELDHHVERRLIRRSIIRLSILLTSFIALVSAVLFIVL
ncbi:hypothetical protein [Vibrio maritimus]|uniref:hypothetical protein n=1 Tax=Vibrio maritimus TaxID=990268 RepID=UPI000FFB6914|nr:hypothetical protein [Vibrio maritimus]